MPVENPGAIVARVFVGLPQLAVSLRLDAPEGDLEINRAAAGEIPTVVPVGALSDGPFAAVEPGLVNLREAFGIVFVIADDGTLFGIETENRIAIDESGFGRNGINDLGGFECHRQLQECPGAGLPVNEVAASGIRKV